MKPKVPDGYSVEYEYIEVMSIRPPKGKTECVPTLSVVATVYDTSQDHEVEGEAIFNPADAFSLGKGKDIALGRALKKLATKTKSPGTRPGLLEVIKMAEERFGFCTIKNGGLGEVLLLVPGDINNEDDRSSLYALNRELVMRDIALDTYVALNESLTPSW